MSDSGTLDSMLMPLVRAIVQGDATAALKLVAESPALASSRFEKGATRRAG